VSFSGIDGAGKSTQIAILRASLTEAGLLSSLLTFWDDVAVFSRLREVSSQVVFRGDPGRGTPHHPISRKDKNVDSRLMVMIRLFFYALDAACLGFVVARSRRRDVDVVIFDRYIYDELANLPLRRWYARAYVRFLLRLAPEPDVAYLVDADPSVARRRKPEYPLEFMESNRAAYLRLSKMTKGMTLIASLSVVEAQWMVVEELVKKLPNHKREFFTTAKAVIES
jgi:thymidylate kinase